jgi:uncharacterized protein YndB with AHSA1/START domain
MQIRQRFFIYKEDGGIMSGDELSVMFTLDRPPREVWPYFKDFNVWHSAQNYYTAVVGDCEGKTYRLGKSPNESAPFLYHVVKVVPEHLILCTGPVPEESHTFRDGIYVFMLTESEGGTRVTCFLQVATGPAKSTEEEVLKFWDGAGPGVLEKWRDGFIPTLRKRIAARE